MPLNSSENRLSRRLRAADYTTWRERVERTGGCTHPVKMTGHHTITHATTGEVLSSFSGHVFAPCGNRRESVCVACSDRYAADAFHLLRAGLSGGTKDISVSVADKPRLFVTLTAPSFGTVHNRRTSSSGKLVPCPCGIVHSQHDPRLGQPLDSAAYDYTGHVLWQAHAGQLWNRFITYLKRHLARAAGITTRDFPRHAKLSYAKVAEYQRRGIIHFHAVIRLDGPAGTASSTPRWGTGELLTDAVNAAHAATQLASPEIGGHTRELTWGSQIDIRPIRPVNADQVEDESGTITDDRIASYVAKYATKGTGKSEATDRPIRSRAHIDALRISEHHRKIIHTAWDLGAPVPCPDCHPHGEHHADGCSCEAVRHCGTCGNGGAIPGPLDHLNLRRWAHMLAFRGHFLSKSRAYSVTFTNLRQARTQFRHEAELDALGIPGQAAVTVINHWDMTSVGHHSPEERELAAAIADRKRQARQHKHATERKD